MKILVLAGGADQVALIKELQKRGHEVILLDFLDNPPAKEVVTTHIKESTLDSDKVKEVAVRENVDMICTACTDQALLTVAKVSEELNLPTYISYEKALSVTNKAYMKKKMRECGIPTSNYLTISGRNLIPENLSYPLIVKPADCNSSKGVVKVRDIDEYNKALEQALLFSRTSTAIVEEFVEGDEISADFYIDGNTPIFLSATKSTKIKGTKGFTITGSIFPVLSTEQQFQLIDIASKISKGFDISNVPLLIQLIYSKGEFYVVEFSARMGGGSKYRLIQEISGVDIMSKYVDLILGTRPNISPITSKHQIRMIYIYTNPGKVDNISGLADLIKNETVKEFFQYKPLGSVIDKADTSSDRILGLLVVARSKEEMDEKIIKINSQLAVLDELGKDIMRHDLLVENE